MKNGQIFAHKSTARGRLDLEYLDETSGRKETLRERTDMGQQIGSQLRGFTDYASKETLGQVHVGGFLHDLVRINPDGTSTAPTKLSNAERKRRITDCWQAHLEKIPTRAKRPVIAHRLIFSMSEKQHDAFVSAGLNPDQILHSTMKKVMRKFAETFHPEDSIGYAYGLHHDTARLHVHLALCPRTAEGKYVGCSTSRYSKSRHKKQMDVIKAWFVQENQRWDKILGSPQEIAQTVAKRLDSDRLFFSPKLTHRQLNALRASQTHEAIRLQQLYQGIRNLESTLTRQREALTTQRDVRLVGRLMGHRPSKLQKVAAKINGDIQRRSIREMQTSLFQLKRQYRALYQRYSQLYGFSSYAHRNAQYSSSALQPANARNAHSL